MSRHENTVRVDCKVLDETPDAVLVEIDIDGGRPEKHWIPLSTVHEIHKQDGYIVADEWIVRKKGIA